MLKKFVYIIAIFISLGFAQVPVSQGVSLDIGLLDDVVEAKQYLTAKVLDVVYLEEEEVQIVKLKFLNGENKGNIIFTKNNMTGNRVFDIVVSVGDKILLWQDNDFGTTNYSVADFIRADKIVWLVIVFVILVLWLGRGQGFKALISLVGAIALIYYLLLPLILRGVSPVLAAILLATIVSIFTFLLISGLSRKSFAAMIGTIGGVCVAGLLAVFFGSASHLTGLATEEPRLLLYSLAPGTDFQGILFSGIIIGALGAVMDVAISIASAVEEVRKHRPDISSRELFASALAVGKDVMSTMTNTLILAYTGSSLPLLLLFSTNNIGFVKGINLDMIATELVRALAGSIGLIVAIPLTAYVAAFILYKKPHDVKKLFD